jgi:hypothetical protein
MQPATRNKIRSNLEMDQAEIILYKFGDQSTMLEVRVEDETVWLNQAQMVELFSSSKQNISLHINNIYKESELNSASTVKEYLTVQREGERTFIELSR